MTNLICNAELICIAIYTTTTILLQFIESAGGNAEGSSGAAEQFIVRKKRDSYTP